MNATAGRWAYEWASIASPPIATVSQLRTTRCPTCMRRYVCTVMTMACAADYPADSAHDVGELLFPPANLFAVSTAPPNHDAQRL